MELTEKNAEKLINLIEEISRLKELNKNIEATNGIRFYKNEGDAYSPFLELETSSSLRSSFKVCIRTEIRRLEDEKNKLLN